MVKRMTCYNRCVSKKQLFVFLFFISSFFSFTSKSFSSRSTLPEEKHRRDASERETKREDFSLVNNQRLMTNSLGYRFSSTSFSLSSSKVSFLSLSLSISFALCTHISFFLSLSLVLLHSLVSLIGFVGCEQA